MAASKVSLGKVTVPFWLTGQLLVQSKWVKKAAAHNASRLF